MLNTVSSQLEDLAARFGDHPALRGAGSGPQLSQAQLNEATAAFATRLAACGIGRSDTVLMGLTDGPAALQALLGIMRAGIAVCVPPLETIEAYRRILRATGAVAIVMEDRPQSALAQAAREAGLTILSLKPNGGLEDLTVASARARQQLQEATPEDTALFALTSGATAAPKVVMLSHDAFLCGAQRFGEIAGTTAEDRALVMMPIAHLHSLWRSALPVLLAGGEVIWAPGFDSRNALRWLDTFTPSYLSGVPSVLRQLAALADTGQARRIAKMVIGSDKVATQDITLLQRVFGADVFQFYGMSETAPCIAIGANRSDGSVGALLPDWSVRISGPEGGTLPFGESGEIQVRGAHINPLLSQDGTRIDRRDAEGWFATGDVGALDAEGILSIHGRTDDRITRGGQKIAASAVEQVIGALPQVGQVMAFGLPDAQHGQVLGVAVTPEAGQPAPTRTAVLEAAAQGLTSYMVPEHVFIMPELPVNAAGKPSRQALVETVQALLEEDVPSKSGTGTAAPASPPLALSDLLVRNPGSSLNISAQEQRRLHAMLRKALARPDLPADAEFFAEGGDSMAAVELLLDIEEDFGVAISPAEFSRDGSAAGLAKLIAERRRSSQPHVLVKMTNEAALPPIVLAHGVHGSEGYAADFARTFGADRAIYTLAVASVDHSDPTPSLYTKGEAYADLVEAEGLADGVVFAGYSLGAHVALATAQALRARGHQIGPVMVIDDDAEFSKRQFGIHSRPLKSRSTNDHFQRALANSPPRPFDGHILYFRADENDASYRSDPTAGWGDIAGAGVSVHDLPGSHMEMVHPENLARIAAILHSHPAEMSPQDPDPLSELRYQARLANRVGDAERECALFEQLLEADAAQPAWVHATHALALFHCKKAAEALAAYRRAVAADPWPLNTDARFVRRFIRMTKRPELLQGVLTRLRDTKADHPSVHYQIGKIHESIGHLDEAEAAYRAGVESAPGHAKLRRALAQFLSARGNHTEAAELMASVTRDYPARGLLQIEYGLELVRSGRAAEAVEVLEKERQKSSHRWQVHLHLAYAYRELAREADAIAAVRLALEIYPDQAQALALLAQLTGTETSPG